MSQQNPLIDKYLNIGCGRCPLVNTPQCKVHSWPNELRQLREIVLDCGLREELKWSVPCYTHNKKNILVVAAFNDYCSISFFKGSLLKDPKGILEKPGENSQAARLIPFTSVQQIDRLEKAIRGFVADAIELENSGAKVDFSAKQNLDLPEELLTKFDELPALRSAFNALTPGRQRGYVLFFSAAKQSKTRLARIDKCKPLILAGKGLHD